MSPSKRSYEAIVLFGLVASLPVLAVHTHSSTNYEMDEASFSATLADGESTTDALTVHVPQDAVSPQVDIYLLADTTGSMGSALNSVKSGASAMVSSLYGGLVGVDVAIGLGNYKDFPLSYYNTYAFKHQVSPVDSSGSSTVLSGISSWSASGGADGSEGQFFALDRLAQDIDPAGGTIGWREGSKKIVVWFGDAPGHDAVCAAISGLAYDITESSVTADLVAEDIVILAIGTRTGYYSALDDNPTSSAYNYTSACGTAGGTSGQATRITAATGGTYTTGVNSSDLVATITALVTDEAGQLDNLGIEATGDIAAYVTGISPSAGYDDIDTSSASDWDFEVDFTGVCSETETTLTGTLDAVVDGAVVAQQAVSLTLESCNEPPVAVCEDLVLVADDSCSACDSVDGGSYDPDGDTISIVEDPGCDYGLGYTDVTLTVTDPYGEEDSCSALVTVVDETAPTIDCNSPETITPPDAPISFTALSDDNCDSSSATVEVTSYDCWTVNGAGKVIDKTGSCVVSFGDDTVTIDDSGGVGDIIEWTVTATDSSGNSSETTCSVEVINPSGNSKGNGKGK